MRTRILLLIVAFFSTLYSQVDITKVVADPNTTIFSDGQNTVAGYIYEELQKKTNCCGEDAIYVEIKINKQGQTTGVRAITGKNECYKKSIADIIMPIRWDASKINEDVKTVFIEVKPNLACKGKNDNLYVKLDYGIPAQPVAETKEEPKAENKEETKTEEATPTTQEQTQANASTDTTAQVSTQPTATADASKTTDTLPKIKPKLPSDIPPPKYVSDGDKSPDGSHIDTYANLPGPKIPTPEFVEGGEAGEAKYIKRKLREAGVCGFVHVLAEITIDKNGKVIDHVILKVNRQDVLEKIPAILHSLKYRPSSVPFRTRSYVEFKADVECDSSTAPKVDVKKVPDYLYTDDEGPYGKVMEAEKPKPQPTEEPNNNPEDIALPIDE